MLKQFRFTVFGSVILIIAMLAACEHKSESPVKGKAAPNFELINLQGVVTKFPEDFINQVVIISFWADWCPLCKKEMHDLQDLYHQYHKRGLSILAINISQDKDTATAFIKDLNLSYPILLDTDGSIASRYAVASLPAAVIIDRKGALHTRIVGDTAADNFKRIISSLL
jgi:cytochrome c biogenesis protein CcmG, thiol:disulfide interchange protein DsbE